MENSTNNTTPSFLQTNSVGEFGESTSASGSYFSNLSWTTWLIIIFVLSFLGINIFFYLAKGTQDITDIFKPLVDVILSIFGKITGQVINLSAEGAKTVVKATTGVVDKTADVVDSGLSKVQDIATGTPIENTFPQPDITQSNALNRALNTSAQTGPNTNEYEADESSSNIQNGAPKAGWCYIGEDRGFRSCAKVGVNDKCMSGDIFPSHEICVNPSLRP
jgi:hypothetical protein